MTVSDITGREISAIESMHRFSGLDYAFPRHFSTPLFPLKRAVTDDNGTVIAAAALKLEAEAYLWMNHSYGSPQERWQAVQRLNEDLAGKAYAQGLDQVHCALPPEVAERFGKRLEEVGWKLARPWPLYVFQLR